MALAETKAQFEPTENRNKI